MAFLLSWTAWPDASSKATEVYAQPWNCFRESVDRETAAQDVWSIRLGTDRNSFSLGISSWSERCTQCLQMGRDNIGSVKGIACAWTIATRNPAPDWSSAKCCFTKTAMTRESANHWSKVCVC